MWTPPPTPKTNRASGENYTDGGFSVLSALMTRPLANSSVFHHRQSLQRITNDSMGGASGVGFRVAKVSITFHWCRLELLIESVFFLWFWWGVKAAWLFSTCSDRVWRPHPLFHRNKPVANPKKQVQLCVKWSIVTGSARTLTPWTSHKHTRRCLEMWSSCLFDLKVQKELQRWLLFLCVVAVVVPVMVTC